ncbi:MAG TPA: hypothetical protein PLN32_05900 [Methanoregulaceae archaeon]|nr:hypothetical protein [Methanoregulaceae archaeon]
MRNRILLLLLCAVIVSTLAATSAVSAMKAGQSDIHRYDAALQYGAYEGIPYGTLIIDATTGH